MIVENSLEYRYPQIKRFIVQDLVDLQPVAEAYIKSEGLSDRVHFEIQNFFTPQGRKGGKYVFVFQRGTYAHTEILEIILTGLYSSA